MHTVAAALTRRSFELPADIPPPKFLLGQPVEVIDKPGYGDIVGRIVGLEYTSRDAALALGSYPGWHYTVETPAFEQKRPHHSLPEEALQLLEAEPLLHRLE